MTVPNANSTSVCYGTDEKWCDTKFVVIKLCSLQRPAASGRDCSFTYLPSDPLVVRFVGRLGFCMGLLV